MQVHLSSTLHVGDEKTYADFVATLHDDGYYFLLVTPADLKDRQASEFEVLNVTADPTCPGRVSTDLPLRQHLFASDSDETKANAKLLAIPGR